MDFFERKTAKINSSYGSIGHFDRVELSLGFGVPHGHIQSSHFQRPCVVYGELFLPFFRGIHILDSYDAGLPAPFWASSLEKPRHCRPNFGHHRTSSVKKNFLGCKYTWWKFWTADAQNLAAGAGLSQFFWTRWRSAPTTGQVQCHSALVSSRVV